MSEFSGYMYMAAAPLPIYTRNRRKSSYTRSAANDSPQSQHSISETIRPTTAAAAATPPTTTSTTTSYFHPFRHSRHSSGSQASRSSYEHSSGPVPGFQERRLDSSTVGNYRAQSSAQTDSKRFTSFSSTTPSTNVTGISIRPDLNIRALTASGKTGTPNRLVKRSSIRRNSEPPASPGVDPKQPAMFSSPHQTERGFLNFKSAKSQQKGRSGSVSSSSGATVASNHSTDSSDGSENGYHQRPRHLVTTRNGRTYLRDQTLPYPLPTDLTELHRQSLRTLLLVQVFGGPVCSPAVRSNPPLRVLEVGCGSAVWSMMCHRHFRAQGHDKISFTGIDIAPLAPGSTHAAGRPTKPDPDMDWTFINHDLRDFPWPMADGQYDLIMSKDMSLVTTNTAHQSFIDEYCRLLSPGGTLEIWESDQTIRMLRPHEPKPARTVDGQNLQEAASNLGAYVMSSNTPFSDPLNPFLRDYNQWVTLALRSRGLSAVPCTLIGPVLHQEADNLRDVQSRRLVIPLGDVRWEEEGTSPGSEREAKDPIERQNSRPWLNNKTSQAAKEALRRTALITVVEQIQALELVLRDASGKSLHEWEIWLGKMMADLMSTDGTSWGESLEVGAWWARKI